MKQENVNKVFFILGRERSGTTMLRYLLNQNLAVSIPPESTFILSMFKKYGQDENISSEAFLKDLKSDPYIVSWELDWVKLEKDLRRLNNKNFQNVCLTILKYKSKSTDIVGDKNPVYSLMAGQIKTIFPHAKFIWIIRDYRAQINSMLKVNFERKNIASLAERWNRYNKEIQKFQKKHPNDVLLIRYEDLVENLEVKIKEIGIFLNVSGILTENQVVSKPKIHKELLSHHSSLQEHINTTHIDEWKKGLSAINIQICESICHQTGKQFGYTYTANKLSPLMKFLIIPSRVFGALYIPFQKLLYKLPFNLKLFINRRLIQPNFKFWKESRESYLKNE